jgi:hypothetical protein
LKAVVYDFAESRAGEHARAFLDPWRGHLVCDDFAGYKRLFAQGMTEVGCLAHARRKFYDLHITSRSQIAEDALRYISQLYDVAHENRSELRQRCARPVAEAPKGHLDQ